MKTDFLTTLISILSAVTTAQGAVLTSPSSSNELPARHASTPRNISPNQCYLIQDNAQIPCYSGPGQNNFPVIRYIYEQYNDGFGVSCYDDSYIERWYYVVDFDCFVDRRSTNTDCQDELEECS